MGPTSVEWHGWAVGAIVLVIALDPTMGVTPITIRGHKVTHKSFP